MFPIRDHNPSGSTPYVTYALIVANVLVFLGSWLVIPGDYALQLFFERWGLVPAQIVAGQGYEAALTSMFLHGGWMHLAGNMLFLWIFGDNLEDIMGHLGFALFYAATGLAAATAQVLSAPTSYIPMVGASGAIAGVMGAYVLLFPRARVDVVFTIAIFFRIIAVPAWVTLGVWFGLQIFSAAVTPAEIGGIAYWAHAGGFVAGLLLAFPVWLAQGGVSFWRQSQGRPPHPPASYTQSRIPFVPRRK